MSALVYFWLTVVTLAATAAATGMMLRFLRARQLLDHPNPRSSHAIPTPRGGGLAVVCVLIPTWAAVLWATDALSPAILVVLLGAGVLAIVGWLDDIRPISPGVRLVIHALVVVGALALAPSGRAYLGGVVPHSVELVLVALGWIWFLNLYNFMDGIDGITGVETGSIGIGVVAIGLVAGLEGPIPLLGTALAASAGGFLYWNWHPARVFLGDVGSVPLGFLAGWLLLEIASEGYTIAALILALYYLADATITLFRRALRGEKFWQPHRKHFYQQATRKGWRHDRVALNVAVCNVVLVVLAVTAVLGWPVSSLALAAVTVGVTLWVLNNPNDPEWAA